MGRIFRRPPADPSRTVPPLVPRPSLLQRLDVRHDLLRLAVRDEARLDASAHRPSRVAQHDVFVGLEDRAHQIVVVRRDRPAVGELHLRAVQTHERRADRVRVVGPVAADAAEIGEAVLSLRSVARQPALDRLAVLQARLVAAARDERGHRLRLVALEQLRRHAAARFVRVEAAAVLDPLQDEVLALLLGELLGVVLGALQVEARPEAADGGRRLHAVAEAAAELSAFAAARLEELAALHDLIRGVSPAAAAAREGGEREQAGDRVSHALLLRGGPPIIGGRREKLKRRVRYAASARRSCAAPPMRFSRRSNSPAQSAERSGTASHWAAAARPSRARTKTASSRYARATRAAETATPARFRTGSHSTNS